MAISLFRSPTNDKIIFDDIHKDYKSSDPSCMYFMHGGVMIGFDELTDQEYARMLLSAKRRAASKSARNTLFKTLKHPTLIGFFRSTHQWNDCLKDVIDVIEHAEGLSDAERTAEKSAIINANIRWPSSYGLNNI